MTYDQVIREFGDYRALAYRLGVPHTTVHSWRKRGIPRGRQFEIAAISKGKLKAPK